VRPHAWHWRRPPGFVHQRIIGATAPQGSLDSSLHDPVRSLHGMAPDSIFDAPHRYRNLEMTALGTFCLDRNDPVRSLNNQLPERFITVFEFCVSPFKAIY
jgi:hypothetical protein